MKQLFTNILTRFSAALAAAAAFCGCDSVVYDEQGDCDPVHIIRFNYDMNMKFTDAFPAEVPSVDLYVFDTAGKLVTTVSRHVTRDEAKDFSIELRGLAPGNYNLLAWCGVKDSEHFLVNPNSAPDPAIHHHLCRIHREDAEADEEAGGHIRKDIGRLYHGKLDNEDFTAEEGRHEHTIYLTKNTNVIRVVLQHLSGAPMDKNRYDISISDENGLYDHKNGLLADMNLTYHPWVVKSGEASFLPEDQPSDGTQTSVSAVIAELTVGRLMENRKKNAVLTVRDKSNGKTILSIPLIETLLLVKGHYYSADGHTPMSDQEYLDRQDEYPLTFFLDQSYEWISTFIYINAWRVVLNNQGVH